MTTPIKTETELSPLDQIRQTEADVARQIASSRDVAGQTVTETKNQAKEILNDARHTGRREGEKRYREIISTAEEKAQALIAQAHTRSENLRRRGRQRLETGVHHAMSVIVGLEEDGEGE
jgi:flagellar biosynthesis/type III secretory pathway protein FliH